ncbi:MAG: intradiol ring-cleavage dioxygenase [Hyphomicrobium sp.]|nr:intradiol ring-cleavage dioxygenase [Hyphomicrobium sp.]
MIERLSRRQALWGMAIGATSVALPNAKARAADPPATPTPATLQPAAATQSPGTCTLVPQAVEGPFYFDPKLVRRDITGGRPGVPLRLDLTIIEQGPCTPIADARVDVWHSDARGVYSGYRGQGDDGTTSAEGESYLRGTQMTDGDGRVVFDTIFPGWYPGRTAHIHVKVFLDTKTVLTGQLYFPDALAARIYAEAVDYRSRGTQDTTNDRDFIFRAAGPDGGGTVLATTRSDGGVTAALTIAVDRTGDAARGRSWLDGVWR